MDRQFAELDHGRYYRYQDVLEITARFAHHLVNLGVKPGDRVAAQVPKSIEALMLYLATVRAGGVFLPLNTAYTANEITYFLEDATPAVFVCDIDAQKHYAELATEKDINLQTLGVWQHDKPNESSLLLAAEKLPNTFDSVSREPNDLAAILYTSGTTGRAKGAMLTHENLLSNSQALVEYWQFSQDDVLLHALPIYHTHGLFVATNVVMLSGSSLIFLNTFNVEHLLQYLPQSSAMMGVPTFYTRLLDDARFDRSLVKHMRVFISGSAPLLADTHIQFEQRTGHRILERYGMTETNMNTSNPYDGERRAGTVGFALPGVDIRVVDSTSGQTLANGETGSIEVRGSNVFTGYWNMPEKTREEFRDDGFFITGDLGVIDSDGYLSIVGRGKDLIITGGFNVYPKEVELILDEQVGVLESAVVGVPHPDFGEAVVAVIVSADNQLPNEHDIAVEIKEKLASFKQPKKMFIVEQLPRNTMGKVQKNKLRAQYQDIFT